MGRRFKIFLSIILLIAFIVCNMTSISIAEDSETTQTTTSEAGNEPSIVKELVSMRELCVKQFELSDSTFELVTYGRPIHYEEDGVIREIDNRMSETVDSEEVEKDEVFQNTENSFVVKISKELKSEKLVRMEKDGYKLTWGIENIKVDGIDITTKDLNDSVPEYIPVDETNPDIKKEIDSLSEDEKKLLVPGLTSIVNFNDVRENIDIQYVVDSSRVKENIILKEYVKNPEFTFVFNTNGLKAKINEDKSVIFYDENDESKEIMFLQSPVMCDANSVLCTDIEVELIEENKQYKYKIKPSSEWLSDESRVFPLVIDPPIETDRDASTANETSVFAITPFRMTSEAGYFWVGTGNDYGLNRAFTKFKDIPELSNAFEVKPALGVSIFL